VVQLDQRGSGRSTPYAGAATVDLTAHLSTDLERLREHLGLERWLVAGISWGTTLALAYAQAHPERVTEVVLTSVVTTRRAEVEGVTRAKGRSSPRSGSSSGTPSRCGTATATSRRRTAGCCTRRTRRSATG
jgi:proline iminopeptidase